jgi:hypothetical protein
MEDSISAVVAHGLLNSLAVVTGGTSVLARAWDSLSAEKRREVTEMALSQAELMADGLDALPSTARHRLANHLFIVRGVCETLMREGEGLPAADREHLLGVVKRQASQAAVVLEGVARALPAEVQALLSELDDERDDTAVSGVLG